MSCAVLCCVVLCCEAWCVAGSGGELTLQQSFMPESCSLNSRLGNKDKPLCWRNIHGRRGGVRGSAGQRE